MHNETQQIEINAVLGQSKLKLRRDGSGEVIGIGITTPDYNVTTIVNIPDFLTAARVLCEGPVGTGSTPSQINFTGAVDRAPTSPIDRVLQLIARERARQNQLVDAGKIPWNCANPMVCLKDKSLVWTEEVLEATREFFAHACAGLAVERHEAKQRLRTELIQVAAVTVAILESMEGQP